MARKRVRRYHKLDRLYRCWLTALLVIPCLVLAALVIDWHWQDTEEDARAAGLRQAKSMPAAEKSAPPSITRVQPPRETATARAVLPSLARQVPAERRPIAGGATMDYPVMCMP